MLPIQSNALMMSTHVMHATNEPTDGRQAAQLGHAGPNGQTGPSATSARHAIMWIDGIGGYLLWDKPELVLGQAYSDSHSDVGITGDLSRRAAVVRRMGSDYLLQPLQATRLNGQPIDRPELLRDGAIIELGTSVKLRFRRPHALSGTARLEIVSIHHWKPNVDAIILLADCCMIGPRAGSHIPCNDWSHELLLIQKPAAKNGGPAQPPYGNWQMRSAADVQVNSQQLRGQFAIGSGVHVRGEDFSLSFE